jgi:hypothetical protein
VARSYYRIKVTPPALDDDLGLVGLLPLFIRLYTQLSSGVVTQPSIY